VQGDRAAQDFLRWIQFVPLVEAACKRAGHTDHGTILRDRTWTGGQYPQGRCRIGANDALSVPRDLRIEHSHSEIVPLPVDELLRRRVLRPIQLLRRHARIAMLKLSEQL